ncbi:MAG TPA: HlyD family secretion protein [Ancylobacter sp.]
MRDIVGGAPSLEQGSPNGPEPVRPASPGASLRRLAIPLLAIIAVIGLLALVNGNWDQWVSEASFQSTEDAYIHADVSVQSARVTANVTKVLVDDFQRVRAGDRLVQLDTADYEAAVEGAQAGVAGAQAALENLGNQEALQRALIAQVQAQQNAATALQTEMSEELERQRTLLAGGVAGTEQRLQQATANYQKSAADVKASEAAIEAQTRQMAVLVGQENTLRASLSAANAALKTAQLKLGYTSITAPFDGIVGARLVQDGEYVNIGTNLIAVVPIPRVYVIANFKETQLTRMEPGQAVEVTVDTFPGESLRGKVERLAPASGAVFALLPPDNATGNFTKVVQRIPVRIALDPEQPLVDRLRGGMSVAVRVHTDAKP